MQLDITQAHYFRNQNMHNFDKTYCPSLGEEVTNEFKMATFRHDWVFKAIFGHQYTGNRSNQKYNITVLSTLLNGWGYSVISSSLALLRDSVVRDTFAPYIWIDHDFHNTNLLGVTIFVEPVLNPFKSFDRA